ncbi:MAG: 4-alpha-glucanotransferase, partial [Pyrinomonadaceae bacterium]
MNFSRASGILLHPTSLPGPFGIGDLGPAAYAFADFLVKSGQSLWQMLPLGPTGYGDSPYACYSAFAGNALLISPDQLVADGLLSPSDLPAEVSALGERVNFERVHQVKDDLLRKAYQNYRQDSDPGDNALRNAFETFTRESAGWLDDYALFRALKDVQGGVAWNDWEPALRSREPAALERAREELHEEIEAQKFYQFLFSRQWFALKAYCNDRGIKLVGDIPIFVAHDSADVWTNPDQFKLN